MGKGRAAAVGAALVALCVAVFGGMLAHETVDLDDLGGILANDALEVGSLGEALRNAWTQPFLSNWIPLTQHSHQLDRWLFGADPAGPLGVNLALHALSTLLLFGALRRLTGALGPSAFVAAVFAVHPTHVESVAWISERKGVLSGVFFHATLWAYARWAQSPGGARLAGVYAAFACALLAKPTTVTLPCVLLLLDFWPLRRLGRRAFVEKLPMLALVALASFVTFVVQRDTGAMRFAEQLGFAERIANALAAYATYLADAFWPRDLAAFYAFARGGPSAAHVAAGLVALGAGSGLALWQRARRPWLATGWFWFVGMLVPMLGLVQVGEQSHADRYLYLSLSGLAIAVAWSVADVARRANASRAAAAVALVAVIALGVAAREQLRHWRDGLALWQRVLEVDPTAARGWIGIGSHHARRLELDAAEEHYLEAWRLDPDYASPVLGIYFGTKANHLRKRGDPDGALEALRRAAHHAPRSGEIAGMLRRELVERARAAEREARWGHAIALRREVLARWPTSARHANDLAWLMATAPEASDAERREALALAQAVVAAQAEPAANELDTLAAAHAAVGEFARAVETAERALAAAGEDEGELAAAIAARRDAYRRGVPHREGAPR